MIEPNIFQNQLLCWFDIHGRKGLPWQQSPTPYSVWVSEIMLQQTQVKTVIPFFNRFMSHYPNVEALASSPQDKILELWAGLGYYARARNLHSAAKSLVSQHQGQFPKSLEHLTKLPGIGRSTAGAILSLGMGIRAPILDGNVKRVLARQTLLETWPGSPSALKRLWILSDQITPDLRPGDFNQAMMDLGAILCTRKNPNCLECPVKSSCKAFMLGTTGEIPIPRPRKPNSFKTRFALILTDRFGRIYLERRPNQGIWGGLKSVPDFENLEALERFILDCTGSPQEITCGTPLRHAFTHFTLLLTPVRVNLEKDVRFSGKLNGCWFDTGKIQGTPAPIIQLLKM